MAQEEIRVSGVSREEFEEMQNLLKSNSKQLNDMAIKYNNRFERVITDQQTELDKYREGIVKETLNATFKSVAAVYDDGKVALSKVPEGNFDLLKKRFEETLDSILQVMSENEVEEYNSEIGAQYNRSKCKVLGKEFTSDKERVGQVIKSYNTGFFRGAAVLVPELVDIYAYDANLTTTEETPCEDTDTQPAESKIEEVIEETIEEKTAEPEVVPENETTEENNTQENN
ncbi:MAG: hypothetical protein FWH48_02525 [Oscillospiraceae bacterium]|nr:hypothetical protein [Oscillospiraceae bacterium]